jgi:uncharacterized protein
VWVVTGASSGIGRRTALDAAALGARVCVAARREERLRTLVEEMGGEARGHSWMRVDVARRDDVSALAARVEDLYGRCDVLVNNAGFSDERFLDGPDAIPHVERIMATNFLGAVYGLLEFVPLLERSAPSSVVNVASMAGRVALGGSAAYGASKFALVGWSESVHHELATRGIYVSSVEPGLVPTEGFPQTSASRSFGARLALSSVEDVSRAIRDAVDGRKMQRVVPRWYYLMQLPRVLTPPLFRLAQAKLAAVRRRRTSPRHGPPSA